MQDKSLAHSRAGRSEKDRFNMAYSTGGPEERAETFSALPVYICRFGENGWGKVGL
jgi:hypothetical protein